MSDDRTIHMFWHGGGLPPLAHACIQSFISHGHLVRVHAYHPLALPADAVLEDAREVIAVNDPLYLTLADRSVHAFTNCFRFILLHLRGGWWVDTDVYCLTTDLPNEGRAWAEQEPSIISNGILRFPKGDPLCERLAALVRRTPSMGRGGTGPDLLTSILSPHHDGTSFGSRETFYPLHWLEAHFLWLPEFKPEVVRRMQGAAFLHCWAGALHEMGIDPRRSAPAESFLAEILRHAPDLMPLTRWQRLQTQRRIGRFVRQPWVRSYWDIRVGGAWDGLAHTSALYLPTPREAWAAARTGVSRFLGSRWPGLRLSNMAAALRAAKGGIRLPPGSLRPAQHAIDTDPRFFLKRAQALGPIFKVTFRDTYTTCVLGHERGMRLLAANESRLPGVTFDSSRLFPLGVLREMTGETHQRYRRLFVRAMQATPLSVHQDESKQIIRNGLAALAHQSQPLAGDSIRDRMRQMTTRIMFRVLFGLREGSSDFRELEANYRRFGAAAPVGQIQDEHACSFAEITAALRRIAQDMRRDSNRDYPACFLRHLAESGALDKTLLGNLAYLFELSHFDLYSLWHWVLTLLATHPAISSTFAEQADETARRQYSEAIVLETLRMEQSEMLYRRVTDDIAFDGFLIPAGTNLRVCIWEGHKDAAVFPNPFTFNPTRFLGQTYGREKFSPFGLGQRHCVGANLVIGLSTIFVEALLKGYTLEATEAGSAYHGPYHWQPDPACAIRLTSRTS
jgi:cytochrome P450